jgi:hypothetical protein
MENCDNKECPICMELITSNNCCTTECNHTFHSSCLFKNFANSAGCPLCRKELIVYPEESDSDEDSEVDSQADDDEDQDQDQDQDANQNQDLEPSLTLNQILHVLKKQEFSEKDLLNSILMHVWYEDNEINEEMFKKNEKLTDLLYSIFNKEIAVDYRDSRTYAAVILGLPKTEETGEGPKPIF